MAQHSWQWHEEHAGNQTFKFTQLRALPVHAFIVLVDT